MFSQKLQNCFFCIISKLKATTTTFTKYENITFVADVNRQFGRVKVTSEYKDGFQKLSYSSE